MKNVFKIYKRDILKISTNWAALIMIIVLIFVPSLYSLINIKASWDPYGNTGGIKVAIINEDKGTTFKEKDIKIGIKTTAFIPDIAILDSNLTMSMPKNIAAETGMDALTHLIESYINKNIDYYTECISEGAIINLIHALPSSCLNGDSESRDRVHVYQSVAGSVLTNVGLGMAHGIAHAFGGKYDLGHGLLNGICLPYVLLWNKKDPDVKASLDKLSSLAGEDIISAIINLNDKIGIPKGFYKILDEETFKKDLTMLVENSLKGSTQVNPVKISKEDMELILTSIYYGKEF